jgi:hypothetical protein
MPEIWSEMHVSPYNSSAKYKISSGIMVLLGKHFT